MSRLDSWLQAKYTGNAPGSDRFKKQIGEYHASSLGKCPRQTFYKFTQEQQDDWSPYFELGRQFEAIYGAALCWEYDDISEYLVSKLSNYELVRRSNRVFQDVACTIEQDDFEITGESDWVIIHDWAVDLVDQHGDPEHVYFHGNKWRVVTWSDGFVTAYHGEVETPFQKVIETKTTKKIEWRKKYGHKTEHEYQVGTYMWAFRCRGEIAYMTRNELDEMVFEFGFGEQSQQGFFADLRVRAEMLHFKLESDELPEADPPRDNVCKYCDFKESCKEAGGKVWD